MTRKSTPSHAHDAGRIARDRTKTPLLVLAVALCLLMTSEAWVSAELTRSEHERVEVTRLRTVSGTVTKVDLVAGTVRVAWGPFGVLAKTLEVEPQTRISVVGRPATLEDIRETATVRAGYHVAHGRSIANSVDLVLAPSLSTR